MNALTNFHGKMLFFKVCIILLATQNSLKLKEKGKRNGLLLILNNDPRFGMFDMTSPFHDYRPGALMYAHQQSK